MNKIIAISKKELETYFNSSIAYIVLIITISVFNIFFFLIIDEGREATLHDVFKAMEFLFIFIVPLLTMKVFSEEKFTGTMEFLMTTPTTNTAIVLGKYLGSLIFLTLIIGMTSSYYFIIRGGILYCYRAVDFFADKKPDYRCDKLLCDFAFTIFLNKFYQVFQRYSRKLNSIYRDLESR